MTAPYGEAVAYDELTTLVRAANPGPMTLEGTNTYLLGSPASGALVVVDPGPAQVAHRRTIERVAGDRGAEIVAVLLTHHHADHAGGAGWARAWNAPLYAFDPRLVTADARPLADATSLSIAGIRLDVVHTPGHTSDHICIGLPDTGAVLTGDHVLGRGTTMVAWPDGDMGAYLRSLERLRAMSASRLYPGHGPCRTDAAGTVAAYLAHRREREQQILAALRAGHHTAHAIVAHVYADVEPALHPAAERSVLAHLAQLEHERRIRRTGRARQARDVPYAV